MTTALKRFLSLLLATILLTIAIPFGTTTQIAMASGPVGDVIFNRPFNDLEPPLSISDIDWTKVDHNDDSHPHQGFEQAYTRARSEFHNGFATPDHVVLKDDMISFYGYGIEAYMDYVFTEDYAGSQGNSFILHPTRMSFHTFSETGYLFNGQMTEVGGRTYYTGYALILANANEAGMMEHDPEAPNTASFRVFYIENEHFQTDRFTPGNASTTRTLLATIRTGINDFDSDSYRTSVEIDPVTRAFKVYIDNVLHINVSAAEVRGTGRGFGFYTGYYVHNCADLTRIRYEDVSVNVVPPAPVTAKATVRFEERGTGTEIRLPETEDGLTLQGYRIVQPQRIEFEGRQFFLVQNSLNASTRSDISRAYEANEANNLTTLYYVALTDANGEPTELFATPPEKDSRVNGGDWNTGTEVNPIPVTAGSEIEYGITAYAPPPVGAMMRMGSMSWELDNTWYNQIGGGITPAGGISSVQKRQIQTITFVNLTTNYLYYSALPTSAVQTFLARNDSWNGKPIRLAWDCTESANYPLWHPNAGQAVNPTANTNRALAWVTESDVAGQYDLFIGGYGGVLMSASTGGSLFANFYNCESIDFEHFCTSRATNMNAMFYYLGYDVTGPVTFDVSGFDTSNVEDMGYMFSGLAFRSVNPPVLDLSSFDASKVRSMAWMFSGYGSNAATPISLDLRWLNIGAASGGTNVSRMFGDSSRVASINMQSAIFSNSTITGAADMFLNSNPGLQVEVATAEDQAWLEGRSPAPASVIVAGAPVGTQPQPKSLVRTAEHISITDTIPTGLTINESSITGTQSSAPAADAITWQRSGQTITWSVPIDMLPLDVGVKAIVDTGLSSGTRFENTAYVEGIKTNTTYHILEDGYRVSEQYFIYQNGPTATKLDDDLEASVAAGGSYTTQGPTDTLAGYTYYGYQRAGIDDTIILDTPPAPAFGAGTHSSNFASTNHEVIKLYYARDFIEVKIHFVDEAGNVIRPAANLAATSGRDFYLPQYFFNNFSDATTMWSYFDYAKEGTAVANQAPPVGARVPGATPLYPNGAVPTFTSAQMTADKNITLYFTTQKTIRVNFVEEGNPAHILHPVENFFVSSALDASNALRADGDNLTGLLISAVGKDYAYTSSYHDGDNLQSGSPGIVDAPAELTLFFATNYTVTEYFFLLSDDHDVPVRRVDAINHPDLVHANITGGSPFYTLNDADFSKQPPQRIGDYRYKGYTIGNEENPLTETYPPVSTGSPLIASVYDDYSIIYLYEGDDTPRPPIDPGDKPKDKDSDDKTSGNDPKKDADKRALPNAGDVSMIKLSLSMLISAFTLLALARKKRGDEIK